MRAVPLAVLAAFAAALLAAPAAAGERFFVGISDDAFKHEPAEAAPRGRDLGVSAARITLNWTREQTQLAEYQVHQLDRAVADAGVRLVLSVYSTWGDTPNDEQARNDYCTFVANVLGRYPAINDVVIWNEPNTSALWRPQYDPETKLSAAPAAYVALLARCWDVLHGVRPGVNVIAPANSPHGNNNPSAVDHQSHSPGNFARRMGIAYRASGRTRRIFDTVDHHPYGTNSSERPWVRHSGQQRNYVGQGDWDKLLRAYWDAFEGTAQPIPGECDAVGCISIWYTETGYHTVVDEDKKVFYTDLDRETAYLPVPDFLGVEEEQPPYPANAPDHWTQLVDGIRLAYCQPFVAGIFNFLLWDERSLERWQTGLMWVDRTPKDSYEGFRRVVREAAARSVRCDTLKGGPADPSPVAPAKPTGTAGDGTVTLEWPNNAEQDAIGYNVYRATTSGGAYAKVNADLVPDPPIGTTATVKYGESGLDPRSTYYYAVTAVDITGHESARSAELAVVPNVAPAAPTALVASGGDRSVALDWAENGEADVTGYSVHRATGGGAFERIASVRTSAYVDRAVVAGTTYRYVVKAEDVALWESEASPEVSATPFDAPPSPPARIVAAAGHGTVSLDWPDGAELDLAGYNVYRSTSASGPYEMRLNATLVQPSAYLDTGLETGRTYRYAVTAVDAAGNESAIADEAHVTPAALVKRYRPAQVAVLRGTAGRSRLAALFANDGRRFAVASVRAGRIQFAGLRARARLAEAPTALTKLELAYDGSVTARGTRVALSAFNWRLRSWVTLDGPRLAPTSDRAFRWSAETPADFVSATGDVEFRVAASGPTAFRMRADLVRFSVEY